MRSTSLVLTLCLAGALFAQQPSKISHEIGQAGSRGVVDVIVKYKTDPSDDPADPHHQKLIRRGGQFKATHHIIHSASYRLNASQLADLASDPDVEFVSPDHPLSSLGVMTPGRRIVEQLGLRFRRLADERKQHEQLQFKPPAGRLFS